jgi:protein gp37
VSVHEASLTAPLRWREPRLVFVNSMSDLFHARVPVEFIHRVFSVMAATPQHTYQILTKRAVRLRRLAPRLDWPGNVWMGVSVENLEVADRVDQLRQVPAAVRFLSCEPLLGPLDGVGMNGIGWVIAGGESGPAARPADPTWVTGLRDACLAVGIPFFFKKWGGRSPKAGGRLLEGRTWDGMPEPAAGPPDPAVARGLRVGQLASAPA